MDAMCFGENATVPRAVAFSLLKRRAVPLGSQRRVALPSSARHGALVDPENVDAYFSVDVETDGPIPGPYSMLSFTLVHVGTFDGRRFEKSNGDVHWAAQLKPISERFDAEALAVSGLDREALQQNGQRPEEAMARAASWVREVAGDRQPVLVAYPLGFDWMWMHWYFVNFAGSSPFGHSRGFDVKTAFAVKGRRPISLAGRRRLPPALQSSLPHTHDALDDAREQGDVFARLMCWTPTEEEENA